MSKSEPKELAVPKAVSIKKDLYQKAMKQADDLGISFSQLVCILLKKELKNKGEFTIPSKSDDVDLSKF